MTKRALSDSMETILEHVFPVLDHGFIRVVDYMGNDDAIVQAARVSYGKGTKKINEDRGLIRYLMKHSHTTPFEMCEIKLHIKMPIFVARQWIRHRTANVNEYSARYSVLDKEFYIPDVHNMCAQSIINNQGRGDLLPQNQAQHMMDLFKRDATQCYDTYEYMLSQDPSIARELARMNLPLNFYTQWYWKIDLHNLLHFCALRADSHAQYEIRVYADILLHQIIKNWVPLTYEAFCDYKMGAFSLSKKAIDVVKAWIRGEDISQEDSGLSKREWEELSQTLR
jgi:thymidylate synthase (FAD)